MIVPRTCSPCELRKLTTGSICVLEYTVLRQGNPRKAGGHAAGRTGRPGTAQEGQQGRGDAYRFRNVQRMLMSGARMPVGGLVTGGAPVSRLYREESESRQFAADHCTVARAAHTTKWMKRPPYSLVHVWECMRKTKKAGKAGLLKLRCSAQDYSARTPSTWIASLTCGLKPIFTP